MKIIWLFTFVYGKTRWNFKSSYFQLCSFPGDFAYDLFEVSLYSVYNDSISSYVSNLLAFWCRIPNINILRYCLWIITLIWSTVLTKKGQIYEYAMVNPFTPMSDQDRISPYNINTISSRQVMRIEKNINYGIISWSNTKFSELTS